MKKLLLAVIIAIAPVPVLAAVPAALLLEAYAPQDVSNVDSTIEGNMVHIHLFWRIADLSCGAADNTLYLWWQTDREAQGGTGFRMASENDTLRSGLINAGVRHGIISVDETFEATITMPVTTRGDVMYTDLEVYNAMGDVVAGFKIPVCQ